MQQDKIPQRIFRITQGIKTLLLDDVFEDEFSYPPCRCVGLIGFSGCVDVKSGVSEDTTLAVFLVFRCSNCRVHYKKRFYMDGDEYAHLIELIYETWVEEYDFVFASDREQEEEYYALTNLLYPCVISMRQLIGIQTWGVTR